MTTQKTPSKRQLPGLWREKKREEGKKKTPPELGAAAAASRQHVTCDHAHVGGITHLQLPPYIIRQASSKNKFGLRVLRQQTSAAAAPPPTPTHQPTLLGRTKRGPFEDAV